MIKEGRAEPEMFEDINHPIEQVFNDIEAQFWNQLIKYHQDDFSMTKRIHFVFQVDTTCENTACRSQDKLSVVTCFSKECTTYNSHRPVNDIIGTTINILIFSTKT